VTLLAAELAGKRLQLLKEAAPRVTRIAVLWNPDHPDAEFAQMRVAAQTLGVQLQSLEVRSSDDFENAFQAATSGRAEALLVVPSRLTYEHRQRIAEFAAKNRLPTISGWTPFATVGGLMAYGPSTAETLRQATRYVDRFSRVPSPPSCRSNSLPSSS
jgi:putative ABC transport system substrate-binding protein